MADIIKAAYKLQETRDAAKRLFKDEYPRKINPYIDIIKNVMKVNELEAIPALLKISKTKVYQDSGMAQMMFISATCDILEAN